MLGKVIQDGWVMVESSKKMWSTGEGNGKVFQYSCLENPMNSHNSSYYLKMFCITEISKFLCQLHNMNSYHIFNHGILTPFVIYTLLGSSPSGSRVIRRWGWNQRPRKKLNYRYIERLEMDSVVGNISGEKEAE